LLSFSGSFQPPGADAVAQFVAEYEDAQDPRSKAVREAEMKVEKAERDAAMSAKEAARAIAGEICLGICQHSWTDINCTHSALESACAFILWLNGHELMDPCYASQRFKRNSACNPREQRDRRFRGRASNVPLS